MASVPVFKHQVYDLALMIEINSGLSEAPPTRNPSTSGWEASSRQLSAVTEPTEQAFNMILYCTI